MKKLIIIVLILIGVIIAGLYGYQYFSSFQKVTINLSETVSKATIYRLSQSEESHDNPLQGSTKIDELTASKEISLQKGAYLIEPEGVNLSQDHIEFSVGDEALTVTVDPGYSQDFLIRKLSEEQSAITSALKEKYPQIANYTISKGMLFKEGEWYGAIVSPNVDDTQQQPDYYRLVMYKENDTWKVIKNPELILTTSEFKDVPVDILKAINDLSV